MTGRTPITSKNSRETLAPGTIADSPLTTTGEDANAISAIEPKPRVPFFQSTKFGSDTLLLRRPFASICTKRTMRSGSGYGSGLSSTPSTTLNTAVAAPMPRPSVRIETSANPGARTSTRAP